MDGHVSSVACLIEQLVIPFAVEVCLKFVGIDLITCTDYHINWFAVLVFLGVHQCSLVVSSFLYHDESILDPEDQKQVCIRQPSQNGRNPFQVCKHTFPLLLSKGLFGCPLNSKLDNLQ